MFAGCHNCVVPDASHYATDLSYKNSSISRMSTIDCIVLLAPVLLLNLNHCNGLIDSPSLFPIFTISASISTSSPFGMASRYTQFSVRVTPSVSQKPSFATKVKGTVVAQSKNVAVAPPCRLPEPLHIEGITVNRAVIRGVGFKVADVYSI